MNQEQPAQPSPERRNDVPVSAGPVRPAPPLARNRILVFSGIGFVIFLVAASPYLIKTARAKFDRAFASTSAPPPALTAKVSPPATQVPSAMPAQQATLSADEQAQKLWSDFEKTTWGAPFEAWPSLHPDIPCKPFRGEMWGGTADRQWAQRCSAGPRLEAAHWSFYVFGLQEPLISRLEQFDVTTGALPAEALTAVQNSLQNRLAARFGPGEDRSPKMARVRPVPWPQYMRWQAPDVEIELNLSEFDPQRKEGRLRLQGRHRALLEALKEDERLKLVGTSNSLYQYYQTGAGMDALLADKLRPDFPNVATMLMKDRPDPDPQTREANQQKIREAIQQQIQSQIKSAQATGQTGPRAAIIAVPQTNTYWKADEFHDALVRLLTSAKTSPRDRQPVLLLAADQLAWRLPLVMTSDKSQTQHWAEWRTQLAGLGASYEESAMSPDENPWTYTGTLLRRVWTDYSETDWGQRAFLLLLSHGWDTGVDCAAGSDQFRAVIQQGIPFLEKYPNSPYRLDVQLAVAQAYETWWSLSKAPKSEDYVNEFGEELGEAYSDGDPAKYQDGAEAARQRAIAFYEQLLQTVPQSDHAAYASRMLPRLKLGFDTGQRRSYCIVTD